MPVLAMCIAGVVILMPAAKADEPSREYQIKAAFIYNFVQFVDWPSSAFESDTSVIAIGVLGANPFGDVLERTVAGKTVKGRSLVVHYFSRIDDVGQCQVLFVGSSDQGFLAALHDKLKDKSVLTIGEDEEFLWTGGVIRFFSDDNKIRFEINQKAAEQAQLKISSKLLRLAKIFTN
jgi:hypothetical protein